MWFTDDIIIDDINQYKVTLMFMIMLIENDVVIEDDIDNNWYETLLVFMIILIWDDVVIDDYVDEMILLLLIMSLRWYDVDVENDVEMRWC